ncbi:bifunctional DNA primase/polymerase, partial [Actinoplanes cyaneus]|uniref:bifunctional DNA primase/polymerase n=1 Tax=Actinoplanes cyaneus TaxID=52696 RepID=UPI0031D8F07D
MIPEQLKDDEYLLKIHGPEADCNHPGKQPVGSAETGPFYTGSDPELESHIQDGGNVGKALKGPLVVFDVDHEEFASELSMKLPPTFVVESGGSGFGQHWYYHCPEWAENRQFKVQGSDYGSLRTGNWQVVIPPSVHPESGNQYQVDSDRLISSVGIHEIENLISGISGIRTANTTGGGGGGGGSVGGLRELPEEYPEKSVDWDTMRSW